MTSEALVEGVVIESSRARTPIVRSAGRVLAVAGILGVVGQLLFFDVGLGINFPIALSLLLTGGWLLRRQHARPIQLDTWLGPGAIVFAAFAAVRADPVIVALDLLTSLALAGGALASFGGRPVLTRSLGGVVQLALGTLRWASTGAVPAIADARHELPSTAGVGRRARPALPVLRGLAIAIPVVLVFVALFSSADAIFARLVDDLFSIELDFGDAGWRIAFASVLAWLAAGGLAFAASAPPTVISRPDTGGWRIGTTEVVTVLLAVDAVFLLFVTLQGAYLFGGLDTLEAAGMTYADYARRGFLELVAVAVLAGGLIIAAERLERERSQTLVAAAIGLAFLTGAVLVSAALRLRLYQEAYGWTELRLYVLATIVLLGWGVIGLVVTLISGRMRWIGHLLIVGALGIGLVLNVIGPVRFISEQNVARVLDPTLVPPHGRSGLDELYAISLGDEALPSIVRALPAVEDADAAYLADALDDRLTELRTDELTAWQAWNAGRAAARDALERAEARGELP